MNRMQALNQVIPEVRQFATFYVDNQLYGIEVTQVQEIAKPLPVTKICLAPDHVIGLINLRGQIATAIGLREMLGLPADGNLEKMSIICRHDGALLSFLVDQIGDVLEVAESDFESLPATTRGAVSDLLSGVYKTPTTIMSVLELSKVNGFLNK